MERLSVWKRWGELGERLAHAPAQWLSAHTACSHVPLEAGDEEAVGLHLGAGAHEHLVPLHQRQPAARPRGQCGRQPPAGASHGDVGEGGGDNELVLDWVDAARGVDDDARRRERERVAQQLAEQPDGVEVAASMLFRWAC